MLFIQGEPLDKDEQMVFNDNEPVGVLTNEKHEKVL